MERWCTWIDCWPEVERQWKIGHYCWKFIVNYWTIELSSFEFENLLYKINTFLKSIKCINIFWDCYGVLKNWFLRKSLWLVFVINKYKIFSLNFVRKTFWNVSIQLPCYTVNCKKNECSGRCRIFKYLCGIKLDFLLSFCHFVAEQ